MKEEVGIMLIIIILMGVYLLFRVSQKKRKLIRKSMREDFPVLWRAYLTKRVLFYSALTPQDKVLFEKRVQRFLATKNLEGVEVQMDDLVRLLVASSAVIPTFAFPEYNYPGLNTVLIYPNSFDEQFQTRRYDGHQEFIVGMVGNRSLEGTVILSKPDLLMAYDGLPHKTNVGIHEFVHLLDKEDGDIDGIPKVLIEQPFVGPWLHAIKEEIKNIERGKSDISVYAIKSNAEFLAVVSEYFFDSPDKFKKRHPDLYSYLSTIFHRNLIAKNKMIPVRS